MAMAWRRSKSKAKPVTEISEIAIPPHFRCPISLELMKDPVTACTGITYDRHSIEGWLQRGHTTCPVTHQELRSDELLPNLVLTRMIQSWCDAHRDVGVEHIPTPKIPLSSPQAEELLSELAFFGRRRDAGRCEQLVARVKALARESERNRRCLASKGVGRALAATFSAFAANYVELPELLEGVLAAMAAVGTAMDYEAASFLAAPEPLNLLAEMLRHGSLAARLNAAMAVKSLLATTSSRTTSELVSATEGMVEALAKLVREPISRQAMKASLAAIYYMVSDDEGAAESVVEQGVVPALVEVLTEPERGMCEKALAVLEGVLSCDRGRAAVCKHALAVPVLAKRMFRVSEASTALAVSALWKLCGDCEKCSREAVQVGAFQKLLLLLQIGCDEETKEKATQLLKFLNEHCSGKNIECVDTMDFKGLNRL
ncbi:U-box domain-containing protein 21-like [Curcuma longa]|uniref:U-box domain-containing protein 21-like n=1 Tax=Curcuma longa TaxID=136217 RepID=UPI003D9E9FC0